MTTISACLSGAEGKTCAFTATANTARRRFCWSGRPQRQSGLIGPLEKLARELRLDPSQYQRLLNLNASLSAAGADWRQQRADAAKSWRELFRVASFDTEAAMNLLRGQGRWLEERLGVSLTHYQQFHASLTPWQHERLGEWLEKGWLGSARRSNGWFRWRFWRR